MRPTMRSGFLWALLLSSPLPTLAAGTPCSGLPLEIRQGTLTVTLDPKFPRVLSYDVGGHSLLAGRAEDQNLIELNGRMFSAGDFSVTCEAGESKADYTVAVAPLGLRVGVRLEAMADELSLKVTSVEEQGEFKLSTLSFPNHHLVRVAGSDASSSMYRSDYMRLPWKNAGYRAGYDQPKPFFSSAIGEEDGEQYPKMGNWVSASTNGLTATVTSNIPYWRIQSQFLGFDAQATDFAFWLGAFHYRLHGVVQPLLEARIALLTKDANSDGKVDWMEAALWQRERLRDPSPTFESATFSYKVMNDWLDQPGNEPSTTFDETLQLIKKISAFTGNAKQIAALTGWQNGGHDSGWPYFDKVNPALGDAKKLQWLAREARKYNTAISYHVNIDDSNADTPGFERSIPVLAMGHDGKPYPWSIYYTNGPQVYRISHTKDFESGFFEERVGAMLKLIPNTNSIQLDTFRPYSISFGPGEDIGLVDEVASSMRIVDWFHQKGIAVSAEGPVDALYGHLDAVYHLFVREDPFHVLMTHGKIYGGGKAKGPGSTLGWSRNLDFVMRTLDWSEPKFDIHIRWDPVTDNELRDLYYLGNLAQSYLMNKRLVWVGEDAGEKAVVSSDPKAEKPTPAYLARFADGTVSKMSSSGNWTVTDDGVTTIDGDYRAIPRGDSEIVLYSVAEKTAEVRIPSAWAGKKLALVEVEKPGKSARVEPDAGSSSVTVKMRSRTAYVLRLGK